MAGNSLTTLEDLGWHPYWDADGHNPVKPGDEFGLLPAEEIKLYWIAKPVQEEDGNWYANQIFLYEPIPAVIGGLYRTETIQTDSTLCGEDESQTLQGKIEEFCFWDRDIGLAGLQNYQMNLTGMIGSSIGDRYTSIASAKADGLKYYYQFNTENTLTQNFTGEGSVCIKTKAMETGSGKIADASILVPSSQITFEKMNFAEEFSMSIRYYLEKNEDFVLFNNPSALKISYDASNLVYRIDFRPYIGDEKTYYLEAPKTKVHEWYDMGVRYKEGILYLSINGQSMEEFKPITTIGGAIRTILDARNIESFQIKAGSGAGLRLYGDYYYNCSPKNLRSSHNDRESLDMRDKMEAGTFNFEFGGAKNMMALMLDKENDVPAGLSLKVNHGSPSVTTIDEISNAKKIGFSVIVNAGFRAPMAWSFEEDHSTGKIKTTHKRSYGVSNHTHHFTSTSMVPNILIPGQPIELVIKTKGTLVEQPPLFPKVSISPGTRIKVVKTKMTPPEFSAYNDVLWENGRHVLQGNHRYTVHNPYNFGLILFPTHSKAYSSWIGPGKREVFSLDSWSWVYYDSGTGAYKLSLGRASVKKGEG